MNSQSILDLLDEMNEEMAYLHQQAEYEQAVDVAVKVRDLARLHLGEDDPNLASALNNLAFMYEKTGKYLEAEPAYREAIEICRRTLGENDPDYATSLNNLAALYFSMGVYAKAKPLFLQSLNIRRTVLGERDPVFAQGLNNLAELYRVMGDYTSATPIYYEAIKIQREVLGEDRPELAATLANLAALYRETGNFTKSESFCRQAIDITRASLGEKHPQLAFCLNTLALLHESKSDYAAAESLHRQAIEINRTVLGEGHPYYAAGLNNLASLYRKMSDYAAAESLYCKAIEIQRTAVGEDHPNFGASLNNLSYLYQSIGNYAAAERLCRQAIEILGTALGEEHQYYATCVGRLADLYQAMGHYAAAEPLYRQVIELLQAVFGEEHPSIAGNLSSLAALCGIRGDYGQAKLLYHQVISMRRSTLGERHPDFAASLTSLAELCQKMGDYSVADPLYRQAIDIQRAILDEWHPDLAISMSSQASLYIEMGDYVSAEPLCTQAIDICRKTLGEKSPDYATSLNNLGALHYLRGNYAAAEPLLRKAKEIRQEALGEYHLAVSQSLNNLAELYSTLWECDATQQLCLQSVKILRKVVGENHPDVALGLNNLAIGYHKMGDYSAAERLYREAVTIRRATLGEGHPDLAKSLDGLSALCVATSRDEEAMALMQQVASINNNTVGQMFSFGSDRQRMVYAATIRADFDSFLSFASQRLDGRAAMELVLGRKAIGAEALAIQRDAILGGKYPKVASQLREITTLRAQIAQRTLKGPGPEGLQTHRQFLANWNAQKEQLEAAVARQVPEMNIEQKLRSIDRRVVALALPTGATLIEFVRFDVFDFKAVPARKESQWKPARYLAFAMPAGEPDNFEMMDLGEAEPIDRMIATFRSFITGEADEGGKRGLGALPSSARQTAGEEVGLRLREAIFDPLLKAVGDCRQLLISPDGDLSRLPFEALPTDDGGRLIDEYRISYLGAGRDVVRFGFKSNREPSRSLVAADPDFDLGAKAMRADVAGAGAGRRPGDSKREAMGRFERLPDTRREGENIAAMLNAELWTDGAALDGRLKQCESPRILHLATHGFFLEDEKRDPNEDRLRMSFGESGMERLTGAHFENPLLRSGLALAGVNTWLEKGELMDEAEDGLLTAEDVAGLDLLDTELVVLSACDTGLGEVRVGEGVFGLRRAFVLAGAKTLVMSLWKVPDEQTRELMEDFYRRILGADGEPPQSRADALREAQLTMKAKYPEPRYWGAFICQGDPGPLLQFGRDERQSPTNSQGR